MGGQHSQLGDCRRVLSKLWPPCLCSCSCSTHASCFHKKGVFKTQIRSQPSSWVTPHCSCKSRLHSRQGFWGPGEQAGLTYLAPALPQLCAPASGPSMPWLCCGVSRTFVDAGPFARRLLPPPASAAVYPFDLFGHHLWEKHFLSLQVWVNCSYCVWWNCLFFLFVFCFCLWPQIVNSMRAGTMSVYHWISVPRLVLSLSKSSINI